MPFVDFDNEDILRGKIVNPAWYRLRIGKYEQTLSNSGDSNNHVFTDCIILRNAEDGSTEFEGVPIKLLFSDKKTARGFLLGFFEALGMEVKPGTRFAIEAAEGKEIEAFVENNLYEGRLSNRVNHKYRKAS